MLQLSELRSRGNALLQQFETLWGRLDHAQSKYRLEEIEKQLSSPDAWNAPEKLTPVLREKSQLENNVARLDALRQAKDDMQGWLELAEEENTQEVLEQLEEQAGILEALLEETEVGLLLSAEEDKHAAILEIHPGAGGTEAQDWAEMLLRMYVRWAESHEFKAEYLDYLDGDEAGIKSVTLKIDGTNAYGLLKGEKGIHRLIRISPYDASGRRHTSFASVDVIPDAGEEITIDIKDSDLRIDIFRSSGPGGQSVNTTSSAVRVTHIPTGITAQCQNEKSQHHNKETAMQILRARLYEAEIRRRDAEKQADYASKEAIGWGSQIRTYTLQPYRLVKDHRSNFEVGDVEAVLDGELDALMRNHLLYQHERR
ncbi:peptide chain release factor 2 [Oleidesulfovibrio alaskensis]|uniref:peptide chain release factor 2 n=1 Tax=Oleidesulfovibrio alaskensis TaxID=58180 RepID=UPI001A5651F1|nr:peptide chain release factor 2 [Oleidesulfovibrio alaskensis]MBL3581615.1 peptide chain release factor 2 [Oleidesulfovibrio alaskensis]MBL3588094.1 peptide chain release factor 2 [bacterium]